MTMNSEHREHETHSAVTRLMLSASHSVSVAPSSDTEDEFDILLEDLAGVLDSRLQRRILLPVYLDSHDNASAEVVPGDARRLEMLMGLFQEQGWQVRLRLQLPDADGDLEIESIVEIDSRTVLYRSWLHHRPGSWCPLGSEEARQFDGSFENAWLTASEPSVLQRISGWRYDATPQDLVCICDAAWSSIIRELSMSPDLLRKLESRKFEELVAELLAREGGDVTLTPPSRDGGRDILASFETVAGRHLYLVECKRYQPTNPVGVALVRALYGVVVQERATAGLLVTSSRFTHGALEFARTVPYQIGLRDYDALTVWIRRHGGGQ